MFTQNALNTVEVERVHQWTSLAYLVVPLLFTMNFVRERNDVDRAAPEMPRLQQNVLAFAGVLAVVAFVIIGTRFTFEALGAISWRSKEPERARRLAEPFEARQFSGSNGETLLYRFMKPVDYDSTREYPLVVCLHHGGTHGNDNMKQVDGAPIAQVLSTIENRSKYPAFLFVPQCPEGAAWGGVETLPSIDGLVFEALAAFEAEFSIDEKRRYVTGISGGGYGSWHFICSRPDMFAAGVPVCGGADPKLARRIANIPVWAFHGEDDTAVPVRFSRDMIAAMEAAGGHPKYTEFAGAGHNIWELVKATPGLLDWMFDQKKD
jgi:predicted peptidase